MSKSVRTAVRWRLPTGKREIAVEKLSENAIGIKDDKFEFGKIIDGGTQREIYDMLTKPMVDKALEGFDSTFFAYGQSGTGKTYTMGFNISENCDSNGIAVRIANDIFSRPNIAEKNVFISFIEIYNNKVYDFLSEKSTKTLPAKSLKNLNAVKKPVNNESEIVRLLSCCSKTRHVRATKMNLNSSRSHAILSIFIANMEQEKIISESSINLVDLAGIEGVRNTDHTGDAFIEGSFINKDLLFISAVIDDISRQRQVTSYRNSSLTMILQDSLNTRSFLTLLVCISPYGDDVSETLATLNFAKIAKSIKLKPQLNIENQRTKTPLKTPMVQWFKRSKPTAVQKSFVNRTPLKSLTNGKPKQGFSGIPINLNRPSLLIHSDGIIQPPPRHSEPKNNMELDIEAIVSPLTNGLASSSIEAGVILLPNEQNLGPSITPIVRQLKENYCKDWSKKDFRLLANRLMDFSDSSEEQDLVIKTQLTLSVLEHTEKDHSGLNNNGSMTTTFSTDLLHAKELVTRTSLNLDNGLTEPACSPSRENFVREIKSNEDNGLTTCSTELSLNMVIENSLSLPLSTLKKKGIPRLRIKKKTTENKRDLVNENYFPNSIEGTPHLLRKRNISDCVSEYSPQTLRRSKRQKPDQSEKYFSTSIKATSEVFQSINKRKNVSKPVPINKTLQAISSICKTNPPKNLGSKNYNPLYGNPLVKSSTPFKSVENTTSLRRSTRHAETVLEGTTIFTSTVAVGSRSILKRIPKIVIRKDDGNRFYTTKPDNRKSKRLTLYEGPGKSVKPTRKSRTGPENEILNILNNGSVKEIQELATIGKKTANLIFNHRTSNGGFESIEALQELKFLKYKQFLEKNHL